MFQDSVSHGMLIATFIFIVQGRFAHSCEYSATPCKKAFLLHLFAVVSPFPHLRPEQPGRSTGMDLQLQHRPKSKVV